MSLMKAIENNDLAKVRDAIAIGVELNKAYSEGYTPLEKAAYLGYVDITRVLLEAGASINVSESISSPLEWATWEGKTEVVKLLVETECYGKDRLEHYKEALHSAVIRGYVDMIPIFLEAGIDVNTILNDDGTALHYAADRNQPEVVKLLLAFGADVNARNTSEEAYDRKNCTPLMYAIRTSKEIIHSLLEAGADIAAKDIHGDTVLIMASSGESVDVPKLLLDAGAEVNVKNNEGQTPLMKAAEAGNGSLVTLLVEAGADINATDNAGNSALIYAQRDDVGEVGDDEPFPGSEQSENDPCSRWERYQKLTNQRQNSRRKRITRYLRDRGAIERGLKAVDLIRAVERGKLGEVEALIDTGANVNAIVPNYGIAIIRAAAKGHLEIVNTLLAEGADPNRCDRGDGRNTTALIAASEAGHLEIVRSLLEVGADPHLAEFANEDWDGYTALDRAQQKGHKKVVELLRKMGGNRRRKVPVSDWKGLVSDNLNDHWILVRGNVEEVAEALCKVRKAAIWERDVFEQEVELTNECFMVLQFSGHQWTHIHARNIWSYEKWLRKEDARQLSRELQTKAINYGVSDTAGAIGYELFESGELMEYFNYCCDYEYEEKIDENDGTIYGRCFKFQSKLRQIDPEEAKNDFDFVDAFAKSQDAYIPAWGGVGGYCGTGKRTTLRVGGLDPDDLRMDYVAVRE